METTSAHLRLSRSKEIPRPNAYVKALDGDFSEWAFNEERALHLKGLWREKVFGQGADYPVDLEVGTGNGYFFAHRCQVESDRGLVGIEIKFKPLIQTIRRALRGGASNARMARFNASLVDLLFEEGELNNIFIHHPDPWDKKKKHKHRLIQDSYLAKLFQLQRSDCFLEFKTDSRDYFDWSVERFKRSSYRIGGLTYDLHRSEFGQGNFVTHFEQIFTRQGHPIHYAILYK
ncbi:MAG: tRNA (guanine-N7)-methyltransferase [Bdellovibrionales bacterium]|nr:tRNA (guanine-N7)-methyltransferase [Bdellovibrionales bacterium]